jgi:hypothetical protein
VIWIMLYALGTAASPVELTLAVVAVNVFGMLPISLGGLGLMEGSFAYVMHRYGVPLEAGVATILLMRVLLLPMCAVGGVFFVLERREDRARPEHAQPQLADDAVVPEPGA